VEWQPLALSFEIAALSTAMTTVVGIALAWLLASKRFPGRDLVDVLVTAPMVMPPTVLGYYVLVLVGHRSSIGRAYEALTGSTIVFTKTGAVLAASIGALPLVTKSARAALEAVDGQLVQAARTLGAAPLRAFVTVQLPLALGGIVAGAMLAFARSLGDFGVTLMVAGDIPGETQTASLAIYDAIQANRGGDALGMIAVLSAVALAVLYAANKLSVGARAL
jgi:molybdate transport system permease protein